MLPLRRTTPRPTIARANHVRRWAYGASLLLGSAAIAAVSVGVGESALSPGPLSRPHAMLANDCARCHTLPFRDLRAILGTDAQRAMNAACLDCHGEHLGFDHINLDPHHGAPGRRLEGVACADCHVEHEAALDLRDVADPACVRCHAQQDEPLDRFTGVSGPGLHPDFRPTPGSDPGTLHFDHQVHLAGGRSTCSDCHHSEDPAGAHRLGRLMSPVQFERDCRSCHPLTVEVASTTLDLPHAAPAVVNAAVDRQTHEQGLGAHWQANVALHLYAEAGLCGRCHPVESLPTGATIAPVNITERWYPHAAFDHGQHTAVGYLTEDYGRDAACRHCHAGALSSRHASDVLVPGIETCRQCHGQGASDRCSSCHTFHQPPGPSSVPYEGVDAETLAFGRDQTRFGTRRGDAYWPIRAFLELPQKVWNRPELEPGTEEFDDEVFRRYGLFPAPFENDGLPLGLVRTDRLYDREPGMAMTCELCHSGSLFGQIIEGQPNPFASMELLFRELSSLGDGDLEDPLYDKNPGRNSIVNGADQLGLVGLLIRQPDLALDLPVLAQVISDTAMEYLPEFEALAYVKTPPWYTYRTKRDGVAGYYYDGGHPKDGNFSAFTYLAGFHEPDGADVRAALTDWMIGGHAYLATLTGPAYPFAIDATLAQRGRSLYERHCGRCHGHYEGELATPQTLVYPGLVVPIDEIGTDPHRAHFPNAFKVRMRKILRDDYTLNRGYVAVPLTSVWARAPYLHNGSIPTLAALLRPSTRPVRWALVADPNERADFLQDEVGWRFEPLAEGQQTDHMRVYDPDVVAGLGNEGHTYGADLSMSDQAALLEFLKTL